MSVSRCAGPLDLEFLFYQFHDNRVRLGRGASRIDDLHSLRFAGGDGQVGVADASEEGPVFLFKTVFVFLRSFFCADCFVYLIAAAGALEAEGYVVVEQDGQVGLQIAAEKLMELKHRLGTEFAATALIRFRRIREAVAENDASFRQRWENHFVNMLRARGEHERHLGEGRKSGGGGVEQKFTNFFAGRSTSRLASDRYRVAVGSQRARQFFHLRALAGAVEAFEGNKFSAGGHLGMIAGASQWKWAN